MRTRLLRSLILIAASCSSRAAADNAATPPPSPPDVIKLYGITITGSLRARFYVWDWYRAASGENQYEYSGNLQRVNLSERLQTWDWDEEFAAPLTFGLPMGPTDAAPRGALNLGSNYYDANQKRRNSAGSFPKQPYVRLKNLVCVEGHTLQIGRFTFLDGSEARFPFFNRMNPEDGFGALVLRPQTKVNVGSEFHWLRLSNRNDLRYGGDGVYQPWILGWTGRSTSGRRSLGNLYDTSVEYRATKTITSLTTSGTRKGLRRWDRSIPTERMDNSDALNSFIASKTLWDTRRRRPVGTCPLMDSAC